MIEKTIKLYDIYELKRDFPDIYNKIITRYRGQLIDDDYYLYDDYNNELLKDIGIYCDLSRYLEFDLYHNHINITNFDVSYSLLLNYLDAKEHIKHKDTIYNILQNSCMTTKNGYIGFNYCYSNIGEKTLAYIDEIMNRANNLLDEVLKKILKNIEAEYDYLYTDEYTESELYAREYLFTENGNFINL